MSLAFWLASLSCLLGISHIGPHLKKFLINFLLTKLVQSRLHIALDLSLLTLTLSQSIKTQKSQYTAILTLGLVNYNAHKSFLFYPILFILESHLKKRREGSLENKKLMRLKILIVGDQQIHYHLFYNSPGYMDDTMFKYLYRTR